MSDYLKPHTIVKIRSDLKPGLYGDHCITNNMLKYGGQLATITEVVELDNGPDKYLYGISVDEGIYWWVKDNFEPGTYSTSEFLASKLGLTYEEIVSDFKNSTGKSSDSEVNEDELEEYVRTKYNNFL